MKRIFFLVLIILLVIPISNAFYYYSNPSSDKTATFISKYSSRSMDSQTLDYYEKIKENFDVYIVKDSTVVSNSQDWKTAYQNSDLIFVISLSDEVLNQTRNDFCRNLAAVLDKSVGLIFAGNSLVFSGNESNNISGCLYTQYFKFANGFNNTELTKSEVKIITSHEITDGYEKRTYNLDEGKTIYPVISPNNSLTLASVNGDPDGVGTNVAGDYPLMVLWQGVKYNALSWGITTSKLTGCSNCLGWKLFNQALNWTSDEKNMGFDLDTDKDVYFIGDRISIGVSSHVNMNHVTGKIIYPFLGEEYDLVFTGSGKSWNSIYLLQDGDPSGEYIISVIADSLEVRKNIHVKSMNIYASIDNRTENVQINVDLKDKYDRYLENSKIGITVKKPSNLLDNYLPVNTSSRVLIYNVTESGNHIVYIAGEDSKGRTQTVEKSFYFRLKPNLTFTPENITETVNDAINLTRTLYITNRGNETLTNIAPKKQGQIQDWIGINTTPFTLGKGNYTFLNMNISIPGVEEGKYMGVLNFTTDQGFSILPITINLDYFGELNVYPTSQTVWIPLEETKEIEFMLNNSGRGSLEIKSIEPSYEINEWMYIGNKPKVIIPGGRASLGIVISTEGVSIDDILKTVSGEIEIVTDTGAFYSSPRLTINIVSDIPKRVESFYPDMIQIEKEIRELKEKTDVTSFEEEAGRIREKMENTKELYDNAQFESAIGMYNSIKPDIDKLKTSVQEKSKQLKENRMKTIRLVIIFIVVIVVAIVGYIIYKKVKESGEYSWLYKKWKRNR